MNIAYKCKFCGLEGIVTVQDDLMFEVDKWKSLLVCNRCGDYHEKKRGVIDNVKSSAIFLMTCRRTMKGEGLAKVETGVRSTLERITKRLADIVCEHYRATNWWDQEFVNLLMDRPDDFWKICRQYEKMVRTGT